MTVNRPKRPGFVAKASGVAIAATASMAMFYPSDATTAAASPNAITVADLVGVPSDVSAKLDAVPPVAKRGQVMAPGPASANAGGGLMPASTEKLQRFQELLDDVQLTRSQTPGVVRATGLQNNRLSLTYDLRQLKIRPQQFLMAPYSSDVLSRLSQTNLETLVLPAETEFHESSAHGDDEQIIGIRQGHAVTASGFSSGNAPVSLKIDIAGLQANQIADGSSSPAVEVTVGSETRQMNSGDVAQFGAVDVIIQASENQSQHKATLEGAPYGLRVLVRPAQ